MKMKPRRCPGCRKLVGSYITVSVVVCGKLEVVTHACADCAPAMLTLSLVAFAPDSTPKGQPS